MMTKESTRWCAVLLLGIVTQVQAASSAPAPGSQCATQDAPPVCVLPKPISDELALRALRLQEAVNNGDLSPQEAQKILQGKPFPPRPPHGPGSSAPGARNAAAQHHDRFWRDERRRIAPAEQN